LDVCPTSNVRLGVYPYLAEHPLRRLMAAGVPVTVNSDDPTMFGVTLSDEVATLGTEHGLDDGAISEIVANPPHEAGFVGTPDGLRLGFETHGAVGPGAEGRAARPPVRRYPAGDPSRAGKAQSRLPAGRHPGGTAHGVPVPGLRPLQRDPAGSAPMRANGGGS